VATIRGAERLSRIERQVRGLRNMVDKGRYSSDVRTQASAVDWP
jgi:DNA-binding FrmR family transcriptional regulator